jgi:hypothetical protein
MLGLRARRQAAVKHPHFVASGTPLQRRRWANRIARELRREAAAHRGTAAQFERWASRLEACPAEEGRVPADVLARVLSESVAARTIALLLGRGNEMSIDVLLDVLAGMQARPNGRVRAQVSRLR